ncbi:MAG: ParB/RepB/Spo0J family partition protein [Clostridiales bacterium]|jgi:ParB family chromosome partitioning protein|nr:ParB/RepB/Spo0J family partition protein [Clostridiales bacterium]
MVRKPLGRGLDSLFAEYEDIEQSEQKTYKEPMREESPSGGNSNLVGISEIFPNPDQPRKIFEPEALRELAASIKLHGVISPLIVVKRERGYMIIAGERRWRAAKIAGLFNIPVIVKDYNEQKIKEISLIENLQREDLNPIEAANAIKELMNNFGFTQEEVADRLGKSRPAIANTVRLLNLNREVIELVSKGRLSAGHARCLVSLKDDVAQVKFAKAACDNKITVRDLEKIIANHLAPKEEVKPKPEMSLELKDLVSKMQFAFGTKVAAIGNDSKGRIYIDYYNRDDLDRIHTIMRNVRLSSIQPKP